MMTSLEHQPHVNQAEKEWRNRIYSLWLTICNTIAKNCSFNSLNYTTPWRNVIWLNLWNLLIRICVSRTQMLADFKQFECTMKRYEAFKCNYIYVNIYKKYCLQYTGLVVLALILLLAGGATTFSSRPEYEENLKTRMYELMPLYSTAPVNDNQTEATDAWNKMQKEVTKITFYLSRFLTLNSYSLRFV